MNFVINVLLILFLAMTGAHADELLLRFKAGIDNKAQKLGEILQIDNDTEHWSDLALQSSPTPGEWISKKQIISWMTQQNGSFKYRWEGVSKIQVKQEIQTPGSLLIEKAQNSLSDYLKSRYLHVELKPLSKVSDSEYALTEFDTEIKAGTPPARRICVWLKHSRKHIPVWFEVHAVSRVLVARQNIKINTTLQNNLFEWQERDIAGLPDQPAEQYPQNAWLNATLLKDKILLTSQIKEIPQIIKGQELKVSINNKSIKVIMNAIALNDGYKGQSISIQNPVNKETFVAQVTDSGQAEVYL